MTSNPAESAKSQPLWQYGLFAINSEILVESSIKSDAGALVICDQRVPLEQFDRVLVVGAGKAGAGMTRGLLKALSRLPVNKNVSGIVIVPDNCVEPIEGVELIGGRPAGINEPTERGQQGTQKIFDLVNSAGPGDLVICLISGGGSALTPLPVAGVTLSAKKNLTRFLSQKGATISELNCVRSAVSQIKGGGLVKNFKGHSLFSLIISDVLGNPLEIIASGMTVPQDVDFDYALSIVDKFDPDRLSIEASIFSAIETQAAKKIKAHKDTPKAIQSDRIHNRIIGDNLTAVQAVANMAQQLGFEAAYESADADEGPVEEVADRLWNLITSRMERGGLIRPYYFVSGGEPTVVLQNTKGKGGRNQHLALLVLEKIMRAQIPDRFQIEFVSVGTDGEDGPTDAAGAFVNPKVLSNVRRLNLDPADYLCRNDSYHFFEQAGGLIKTGPTHTNVCDLRIISLLDAEMSESF